MRIQINNKTYQATTISNLNKAIAESNLDHAEIVLSTDERQPILTILKNKDRCLLMYQRNNEDIGYISKSTHPEEEIEFTLANGQIDRYPGNWTVSSDEALEAISHFFENQNRTPSITWIASSNKDKTDELLDLVDENDTIIGTVWKSEAHGNPKLIHREVVACVFNSQGQTLIQQRALTKRLGPGLWRISATGHVGAGEDLVDAVKREVKEELGINITPSFHKKLFVNSEEHRESKFYSIYYAIYDKDDVVIDPEEVNAAKWVKLDEISDHDEEGKINVGEYSYKAIIELYNLLKDKYNWE